MADVARSPRPARAWLAPANVARALSILLPLAVVGVYAHAHWVAPTPSHAGASYDPEMAYLLNSLAPLKSRPYMYYHHPGTPLTILGTGVLILQKTVSGMTSDELIIRIMENPRGFFVLTHGILTAAGAATVYMLMRASRQSRQSWLQIILSASVAVSYFAVFAPASWEFTSLWNHNVFAFPFGTLILLSLWNRLGSEREFATSESLFYGVLAGLLFTVQFYFVAWIAAVAVAAVIYQSIQSGSDLKGAITGSFVGAGALLGVGIGFLPILHRVREYLWWIRGRTLGGAVDRAGIEAILSPANMIESMQMVWRGREVLFGMLLVSMLLSIYVLWTHWRTMPPSAKAIGPGLLIGVVIAHMAVQAAALAERPAPLYMLSLAAFVPLLLLLALPRLAEGAIARYLAGGLGIGILLLFVNGVVASVQKQQAQFVRLSRAVTAIETTVKHEVAAESDNSNSLIRLWAYGAPSHCYGLRFGNIYTERAFRSEVN